MFGIGDKKTSSDSGSGQTPPQANTDQENAQPRTLGGQSDGNSGAPLRDPARPSGEIPRAPDIHNINTSAADRLNAATPKDLKSAEQGKGLPGSSNNLPANQGVQSQAPKTTPARENANQVAPAPEPLQNRTTGPQAPSVKKVSVMDSGGTPTAPTPPAGPARTAPNTKDVVPEQVPLTDSPYQKRSTSGETPVSPAPRTESTVDEPATPDQAPHAPQAQTPDSKPLPKNPGPVNTTPETTSSASAQPAQSPWVRTYETDLKNRNAPETSSTSDQPVKKGAPVAGIQRDTAPQPQGQTSPVASPREVSTPDSVDIAGGFASAQQLENTQSPSTDTTPTQRNPSQNPVPMENANATAVFGNASKPQQKFNTKAKSEAKNPSAIDRVVEEEKRKKNAEKRQHGLSRQNIFWILISLFFFIGALELVYYIFVLSAPQELRVVPKALIGVDEKTAVIVNHGKDDLVASLSGITSEPVKPGTVEYILPATQVTKETDQGKQIVRHYVTPSKVFQILSSDVPETFLTALDDRGMLGVYGTETGNVPFIILKITSQDDAFAGLRKWEDTLLGEFTKWFGLETPKAGERIDTQKLVIKNRGVRKLEGNDTGATLLYTLYNESTLIMTSDEDTLKALIAALSNVK